MFVRPGQIDELMARFPDVKRCQAVVTRQGHDDDLLLRMETHGRAALFGMDAAILTALRASRQHTWGVAGPLDIGDTYRRSGGTSRQVS